MNIAYACLVISIEVLSGLVLGIASGFGLEANNDVGAGVQIPFSNAVLRWLFQRADNLSIFDALLYLLLFCLWLPIFFGLVLLPLFVALKLSLGGSFLLWGTFGPLLMTAIIGKVVGRNLWRRRANEA
jgi:hypothetical protein